MLDERLTDLFSLLLNHLQPFFELPVPFKILERAIDILG